MVSVAMRNSVESVKILKSKPKSQYVQIKHVELIFIAILTQIA